MSIVIQSISEEEEIVVKDKKGAVIIKDYPSSLYILCQKSQVHEDVEDRYGEFKKLAMAKYGSGCKDLNNATIQILTDTVWDEVDELKKKSISVEDSTSSESDAVSTPKES